MDTKPIIWEFANPSSIFSLKRNFEIGVDITPKNKKVNKVGIIKLTRSWAKIEIILIF